MAALPWHFLPHHWGRSCAAESAAGWLPANAFGGCGCLRQQPHKAATKRRDCSVAMHRRKAKRQHAGSPNVFSSTPVPGAFPPIRDEAGGIGNFETPDSVVAGLAGPVDGRNAIMADASAGPMAGASSTRAAAGAAGGMARDGIPSEHVAGGQVAGMWLPSPPSTGDVRANYAPATLAFLGDAIWEVFMRRHFFRPRRVGAYHQDVTANVRAEAQSAHVEQLLREDNNFLTPTERDILRWGRNAAPRGSGAPKRLADSNHIYRNATALECLVGYLYISDPSRLSSMMTFLGYGLETPACPSYDKNHKCDHVRGRTRVVPAPSASHGDQIKLRSSGQVLAVPMTKGVALPGTATSIPWEVEDYRYKLRVLPEYLQTAKDRYGGSLRARLEGLKPMFIRGPGQTSGWQSRERMDIAVNLCHALDVAVKELGVTAVTELACMEYFARIVESLMVVESERGQGAWVAQAAFVLPVVESGSQRTRAARRALKAAKKEHDARVSAAVLAKVDGGAVASSSASNKQKLQRATRRRARLLLMVRLVEGLNWMWGGHGNRLWGRPGRGTSGATATAPCTAAQQAALQGLEIAAQVHERRLRAVAAEDLVHDVESGPYGPDGQYEMIVPERLALPAGGVAGSWREVYGNIKNILREEEVVQPGRRRRVTHGCASDTEYARLSVRLAETGMTEYSEEEPPVTNGLFGVPKRDPGVVDPSAQRQRLICNMVQSNDKFLTPGGCYLPDVGAVAEMAGGAPSYSSKTDLETYYYRFSVPTEWREWFALPPVWSDEVAHMQTLFGPGKLNPGLSVSVPMHQLGVRTVREGGREWMELVGAAELDWQLLPEDPPRPAQLVMIDDLGTTHARSAAEANALLDRACTECYAPAGLVVNEKKVERAREGKLWRSWASSFTKMGACGRRRSDWPSWSTTPRRCWPGDVQATMSWPPYWDAGYGSSCCAGVC
eukprot:jgi/Mesvir1/15649/Mv03253-RA.1